jgi:hypothetical protein
MIWLRGSCSLTTPNSGLTSRSRKTTNKVRKVREKKKAKKRRSKRKKKKKKTLRKEKNRRTLRKKCRVNR